MGFNVGLFLTLKDRSINILDYIQLKAGLYNETDYTSLSMEFCSADKFYEPYGERTADVIELIPAAICLSNHEDIILRGN